MDTLHVFGSEYEVAVCPRDTDLRTADLGHTDYDERRVKIARTHPDQMDETLFHELIHIVAAAAAITLKERQTESLGVLLMGLLKDNGFWQNPDWWDAAKGSKTDDQQAKAR